jgi:ketosteroid isomerase-like protein
MINGKAAIREGWAKWILASISTGRLQMDVARSGDVAYTIYVHQLTFEGPEATSLASTVGRIQEADLPASVICKIGYAGLFMCLAR